MSAVDVEAEDVLPHPAALIAAGVATAGLVVGHRVGVGVALSAVAIALAVAAQRPRTLDVWTAGYLTFALCLSTTTVLTAAPWTIAVVLVAAAGLGAAAVAGGPSWAQLAAAALAPLRAGWLGQARLAAALRKRLGAARLQRSAPLARGMAIGFLLVVVFGTLFVSADRAFAELAGRYLVPDWRVGLLPARIVLATFVTAGGAALASASRRARTRPAPPAHHHLARVEWLTALVALDVLFVAFVAFQITVLFGGHATVLETVGLTYAEYARDGFFQLMVAAGLTLGVVAGSVRWAAVAGQRDRRLLQAALGVLCVCAVIVAVSALRRLGLYEQAFGFTRPRMVAHGVLLWMAALLLLAMTAGLRWRAQWLPRATVATTAAALLLFALLRPDALIAEHNVQRFHATGLIDLEYLNGLSTDAVPALAQLPRELRACVLADDAARLEQPDTWSAANFSRQRARRIITATAGVDETCVDWTPGDPRHNATPPSPPGY